MEKNKEYNDNDIAPPQENFTPILSLTWYAKECFKNSQEHGFWDLAIKPHLSIAVKLSLIHSEVSEALEAIRKDDKENFAEEIADTFIRLFDLSHFVGIDLDKIIQKKMEINSRRPYLHEKLF